MSQYEPAVVLLGPTGKPIIKKKPIGFGTPKRVS
jgi:hypothetical protein